MVAAAVDTIATMAETADTMAMATMTMEEDMTPTMATPMMEEMEQTTAEMMVASCLAQHG